MRHDILEVIAHLEASIDFPEDDIEECGKRMKLVQRLEV